LLAAVAGAVRVELAISSVTYPGFDQYLFLGAAEKVDFESSIIALVDDLE
jgi:hypothetical protein